MQAGNESEEWFRWVEEVEGSVAGSAEKVQILHPLMAEAFVGSVVNMKPIADYEA